MLLELLLIITISALTNVTKSFQKKSSVVGYVSTYDNSLSKVMHTTKLKLVFDNISYLITDGMLLKL